MASHGPRRPPAKDVTVTANQHPPSGGMTCAPATGRHGEPGKDKDDVAVENIHIYVYITCKRGIDEC